ncbi:MAG: rod shape-determining protein MreC [Candidatus Sedimenticola endophacoides]
MFTEGPSTTLRVIAAVLVSLALMILDHRFKHMESLRSVLSVVVYPLQLATDLPRSAGDWLSETFATRTRLQEENSELRRINLILQARQQKVAAVEAENQRLRYLLDSAFQLGERVLIAELIAADFDPYRQQVTINKGRRSGVYAGQPLLDAKGVMGQVTHVNPTSSTVLLITDPSHATPVQVNRNGLRGIAIGTAGSGGGLELPHLPNNADIRVGDELATSGFGGRFPSGYPVAEVTAVERVPGQPFARVTARPHAHLDRIREALLVWKLELPPLPSQGEAGAQPAERENP